VYPGIVSVVRVLFIALAGSMLPATAWAQAPEATIHRGAWGVPHVFTLGATGCRTPRVYRLRAGFR
jgi:acyl-homoserine lactone acylase PvdQ